MSRCARPIHAALTLLTLGATCATSTSTAPAQQPKRARVAQAAAPPAPPAPPDEPVAAPDELAEPAPTDAAPAAREEGLASFYADSLAGNRTASGERYLPQARTCAHRTHPFGTVLRVTATRSGRSSVCRVNDRGPFISGRVLDVSRRVADELGMRKSGVIRVTVEVSTDDPDA